MRTETRNEQEGDKTAGASPARLLRGYADALLPSPLTAEGLAHSLGLAATPDPSAGGLRAFPADHRVRDALIMVRGEPGRPVLLGITVRLRPDAGLSPQSLEAVFGPGRRAPSRVTGRPPRLHVHPRIAYTYNPSGAPAGGPVAVAVFATLSGPAGAAATQVTEVFLRRDDLSSLGLTAEQPSSGGKHLPEGFGRAALVGAAPGEAVQGAAQGEVGQGQEGEAAGFEFQTQGQPGDHGQARSGGNGALDGFRTAQRHEGLYGDPVFGQGALQDGAGA